MMWSPNAMKLFTQVLNQMENENLEKLKKLYADIDENMKFIGVPKVMVKDSSSNKMPGIVILKVKQPDRFIMWLKFKWFKLTQPKRYKEVCELVDYIRDCQLAHLGIPTGLEPGEEK